MHCECKESAHKERKKKNTQRRQNTQIKYVFKWKYTSTIKNTMTLGFYECALNHSLHTLRECLVNFSTISRIFCQRHSLYCLSFLKLRLFNLLQLFVFFSLRIYVFFYVLHLLAIHFHDSLHLLLLSSYSRVPTLRLIQVSCFQIV